jgi:hypothetical protein
MAFFNANEDGQAVDIDGLLDDVIGKPASVHVEG